MKKITIRKTHYSKISRRDFFAACAATVPIATIANENHFWGQQPQTGTSPKTTSMVSKKIAVQLYTVRNEIERDLKGSLKKVADLGIQFVETAFWPKDIPHKTAAGYLKDYGLSPVACHIEISGDYRKGILTARDAYNCPNMIWHGWPEDGRYASLEGTLELIRFYNEIAAFCKDQGIHFGLHNHWWEFMNKPGGKFVFEHWLDRLDPAVFFETDTYWVKVAGHDPATIIRRLGDRIRFLHIKDGPAQWHPNLAEDNPDPMTAVGAGNQDMKSILSTASAINPWLVLEMDKVEGDVFEKLRQSLSYLDKL